MLRKSILMAVKKNSKDYLPRLIFTLLFYIMTDYRLYVKPKILSNQNIFQYFHPYL